MKIDLNKNVKELDGSEIPNANMGKIIAQTLIQQHEGDPLKYWFWANKLYNGEVLDLDKSDKEVFMKFVKNTTALPIITKAQILEQLGV